MSSELEGDFLTTEPPGKPQFNSVAQLCPTLCDPMDCSMPGLPVNHQLPEFTQTHVRWVSDAIQPSHPVIPLLLSTSIFCSIGIFSNESVLYIRWPAFGVSASASVLPMNIQGWFLLGLTGMISLLSKGLSSLLQHHSSKASILQCSALFLIQLSHPYMTTGKTIVLTRQTFVGKVMSRLFNPLSRLVIAFLPRSKRSSQHRDQTQVSCITGRFFTSWATREAHSVLSQKEKLNIH